MQNGNLTSHEWWMMMVLILIYLFLIIFLALIFVVKLYAFFFTKSAGHEMAIVGEPCSVDAHAKIPSLFITMLCPCCVHTCTVRLSHWPIRASHPSRGHHTHITHHTPHRQSQMLSSGSPTKKLRTFFHYPIYLGPKNILDKCFSDYSTYLLD